jgi:tRNA(Ile)-lysidine synthetase-like protein
MPSLVPEVRAFIAAHQMLAPSAPVVVAVSGGPDSLCLLHVLTVLQDQLGVTLHIAHLDHMIRGAESAAEARFVAELAHKWRLTATVEAVDVPALARGSRTNLHAAARKARYAFLARVAQAAGAQAVAVAHHAGDQAETVLLHLLRGAGPEGLRGMRPAVEWKEWARLEQVASEMNACSSSNRQVPIRRPSLIRPLLTTTREAIERYCAEQGLEPRRDPSNLDLGAARNRIRHDLLPQLIEYNPHVVAALGRTAMICAEDQAFVRLQLDALWPRLARERQGAIDFDAAAWRALHPALQREAIRRAHAQLTATLQPGTYGETLGLEHVEQARALIERGVGRRIDLPSRVSLTVGYGNAFTLGAAPELDGPQLADHELALPADGRVALGNGWAIELALGAPPAQLPASGWEIYIDTTALDGPLVVRRRRPGDRIRLADDQSRRLQDLFVDAKVPRALRESWPVIATRTGIVWVAGLRAARAYLATPASEHVLMIRVIHDPA